MPTPKPKKKEVPPPDDDDEDDDTGTDDTGDESATMQKLSDLIDSRLDAFAERVKTPDRAKPKPHGILNFLDSLADRR